MLRFPFVPRDIYEDAMELLRSERMRTEELTRIIVKLKVSGASIPRDPQTQRPLEPLPVDPIEQAIAENKHAQANPRVRAALANYADREKKKGTREETILHTLRTWSNIRADDADDLDDGDDDTIALVSETA